MSRAIREPASAVIAPGQIEATYARIASHIRRTPVVEVDGADFDLKPERVDAQIGTAAARRIIQVRGAFNNLLTRQDPLPASSRLRTDQHGAASLEP